MQLLSRLLIAWARAPEHPAKQRLLGYAIRSLAKRTEVQLPFGRFHLHPSDFIQRHLMFYGEFEPLTMKLVNSLLKDGGFFVDVGANIGLYSIAAARLVRGSGRVVAIEPNPSACAQLLENRRLNQFEAHITVVNAAVGNMPRLTAFGVPESGNQGMCREVDASFPDHFYSCAASLIDICKDLRIDCIDLLKIDVEGAEGKVLEGVLDDSRPLPKHIIFEYLPEHFQYSATAPNMLQQLTEHGYELATVRGRPFQHPRDIEEGNLWAKLTTGP